VYRLGREFIEVTAALIAPDYDAVNAHKLSANPPFAASTRLGT